WRRHLRQRATLSRTHQETGRLSARRRGECPDGTDYAGARESLETARHPRERASGLDRHAHAALGDHLVDGAVVVTQLAQHVARVLADAGSRPADRGLVDLKAGRRLRLPHPPDLRLIELRDDAARDYLFVVDDFAPAKDRRARDVSGVQALQPFGSGVLADILRHLVD